MIFKKGFTLVELLVTISIMAMIMGASLVAFNGTRSAARDTKRKGDVESVRSALQLYRSEVGGYPASIATMIPLYLAAQPADPLADQSYAYVATGCGPTKCTGYMLCARLELGTTTTYPECGSCGSGACNHKTLNP